MTLPNYFGSWLTFAFALIFVASAVWHLMRARRSYAQRIKPRVESAGLTLLRIDIPRFWQTGPFPKIEFRLTARQTKVGPVSGEYTALRKVVVADNRGQEHQAWCRLQFSAFRLDTIEFRPPLDEFL